LSDLLDPEAAASAVATFASRRRSTTDTAGVPGAVAGSEDGILSTLVEVHAGVVELAQGLGVTAPPAARSNAAPQPPKEPT
jgi:hypothetical protein